MDRLKKLLKKYNLEKSQDPLSSLALLKSDWDDR